MKLFTPDARVTGLNIKNLFVICALLLPIFALAEEVETSRPLNPAQYACVDLETVIQKQFFDNNRAVTLTGLNGPNTYVSAEMPCPNLNQKKVAVGRPTADVGIGICDRECFVGFACVDARVTTPKRKLIQCEGSEYLAPVVLVPNFAR